MIINHQRILMVTLPYSIQASERALVICTASLRMHLDEETRLQRERIKPDYNITGLSFDSETST